MSMSALVEREVLPISLVAHTPFCARRTWLEAAGESVASINIEHGVADHQHVDARDDERVAKRQSLDVASDRLSIVGRCDVVEAHATGLRVVEFKSAPARRTSTVTPAQKVQLALQGLCLREMGHVVSDFGVYFTTSRRFVAVELEDEDFIQAEQLVEQTRTIVSSRSAPAPLIDDPRCTKCSHAGVCLPDERTEKSVKRGILVRDPEGSILHLSTPGSRASLKAGRVVVVKGDEELAALPIERVDGVVIHGNVDVSSALIRELLWRKARVVWASGRGSVVGYAASVRSPNGAVRPHQHVMSERGDMALARELIGAKIANQATIARRFSREEVGEEVKRIRQLQRLSKSSGSVPELLGREGEAAAIYFSLWRNLVREDSSWWMTKWPGRLGRGATDPLNIALNLTYGLLLSDVLRATVATGLDPHAGFVHSSSRNKPALCLDLMEQFRPVIADSVVLTAINNGELRPSMFTSVFGDWRLRDSGRKALIAGYERRVAQEFVHPVFGYSVGWRRAMEIQARMVLGVVDGTQGEYVGIRVR